MKYFTIVNNDVVIVVVVVLRSHYDWHYRCHLGIYNRIIIIIITTDESVTSVVDSSFCVRYSGDSHRIYERGYVTFYLEVYSD